jgi:heme-degrading monooxygenase HmoA
MKMKRSTPMFARILDFEVKPEKKEEFVKVVKNEIVPILKKQTGFLEILPFFPEKMREDKVITISLWTTKSDAERYEREFYPKALDILKPFLTTPVNVNH